MITCGAVRRILWPDTGPRPATSAVEAAQSHLSGCAACQRFLVDMRALADLIQSTAARPEAPSEVRNRLFRSLAMARTRPTQRQRMRNPWLLALAVSLVLLVGLWAGWLVFHKTPEMASLAVFADDHMRTATDGGIRSADSSQVAKWLDVRVEFDPRFPIFPNSALRGARLCVIDGQRGAVVEYQLDGRILSYFIVPIRGSRPTQELQFGSRAGYHVVAWHDAGLTHALVGSFPDGELADLARYCIHAMTAILTGIGLGLA